jgi:hypothetical protein
MGADGATPQTPAKIAYPGDSIHLVRTAVLANLTLSQMADQKASILLGATFVVFTIVVGQASQGALSPSLLILAFFAFLSALCAVLVVMPSVKPPALPSEEQNILFFGVFSALSEAEFTDRVLGQLASSETVFRTMLRDIHQNGQVLQRKKYRFLTYAYQLFLAGLTLTLIALLVEQAGRG